MALTTREIGTGTGKNEGPVIRPSGEIIVVSMDQGLLYRIKDGKTSVFADTGHFPNGATEDKDGTIYVTQAGGKRWGPNAGTGGIQKVSPDGSKVSWLTEDPIAPNDLCFGPDGLLYCTDPTRPREARDDGRLFRTDVKTGETELLCSVNWYPNGIGFGIEDDALYVAKANPPYAIMRIPLDNGRLGKAEVFAPMGDFNPDGFTFDVDGNVITSAKPNEIQTFDRKTGKMLDTFKVKPEYNPRNVALSPERMLIFNASDVGAVVAVDNWPSAGLLLHPFRK